MFVALKGLQGRRRRVRRAGGVARRDRDRRRSRRARTAIVDAVARRSRRAAGAGAARRSLLRPSEPPHAGRRRHRHQRQDDDGVSAGVDPRRRRPSAPACSAPSPIASAARIAKPRARRPKRPDVQQLLERDAASSGCRSAVMEVSSHALVAEARRRRCGSPPASSRNLTRDHLDFHEDMEAYFAAKRRLFEMLPADAPGVINLDDPRGPSLVEICRSAGHLRDHAAGRCHARSDRDHAGGPALRRARRRSGAVHDHVEARRPAERLQHPRGHGDGACRSTCRSPRSSAAWPVWPACPAASKSSREPGDDVTVVVDYAHTDDALRNLLETARPLAAKRLITVFGCGGDRDRTKRPLMGMVAARLSDVVVITSDNPRSEDPQRIIEEIERGIPAGSQASARAPIVESTRRSRGGDRARRGDGAAGRRRARSPARATRSISRSAIGCCRSTTARWRGRRWRAAAAVRRRDGLVRRTNRAGGGHDSPRP